MTSSSTSRDQPSRAAASLFLAAALVVAILEARSPFARGWWLVAYLALVGGVAQCMLVPGLGALATRREAPRPHMHAATRVLLWNAGVVLVAVADMTGSPTGVVIGSILLVAALALFAAALHAVASAAQRPARFWSAAYAVLVAFLAISVVVGTLLAFAHP